MSDGALMTAKRKTLGSKTLREGARGRELAPVSEAVSKPKAKKGYIDRDYHGYFFENGCVRRFTTCSGVRYVHPQYIVVKKSLTTIDST